MLFTILTATTSRNSAHAAWESNGKSSCETSLQMSSSLTEEIHNSRKSLLMFSSPWCQAGLSVQLAAVISCPVPAGCSLLWGHCSGNSQHRTPRYGAHILPRAAAPAHQAQGLHTSFFTFKAAQMAFPSQPMLLLHFHITPWGSKAQGAHAQPTALSWSQAVLR